MLENIIRPSNSPWSSQILLVKNKDGTVRFVVDYIGLNDVTEKDSYPLPNIQDILDKMDGTQYWTTLDCASGCIGQFLFRKVTKETAFSVPRGSLNVML